MIIGCTADVIFHLSYFPSFQMSAASFHSFPTFSQTTKYLPVSSSKLAPFLRKLNVPAPPMGQAV
jgi:hypothetical protein